MPIPLTDAAINALMDHEFAIADGKNPSGVSLLGVAFTDTGEHDMTKDGRRYAAFDNIKILHDWLAKYDADGKPIVKK